MSEQFTVKAATRAGVNPLIALYSESGCGKTYSALLLARGIVGPQGKIVMVDTESGRGSLYADVLPGGYGVVELKEPFAPARYVAAIEAAEAAGAQCIIIDSASHEWEGAGGVLDAAAEIESSSGRPGLHCWRKPKFEHALFVARLIRASVPVVACIRAKYKSRQVRGTQEMADANVIMRNQVGKNVILKDAFTSPIQAEDFIFEATVHAEIMPDHVCRLTKVSHPTLRECFTVNAPVTIQTGEAVARWCRGGGSAAATATRKTPSAKQALWDATASVRGEGSKEDQMAALQQWLWDAGILNPDGETLATLDAERMAVVADAAKARLA